MKKPYSLPEFYECGICGAYHSAKWNGDCRQDSARLTAEEIDSKYGWDGWREVDMDDLPGKAEGASHE